MSVQISRSVVITYERDGHRRRASGFHLRDDLVLTAGHIGGASGYAVEHNGVHCQNAEVLWVLYDESAAVDIAVMRVQGLPPVEPVGIALLDRTDADAAVRVWGWCYPSYQPGVQSVPLAGTIRPASGYSPRPGGEPGMVRLALDDPGPLVSDQHPSPGESWSCASGGAVLVTVDGLPYCVGVVSEHVQRESPQLLRVATLEAVHPHTTSLPDGPAREFWSRIDVDPAQVPVARGDSNSAALTRRVVSRDRPRPAPGFVARDELAQVRAAFGQGSTVTLCALQGMRGVGKTQVAAAYAEECERAGWPFVAWINAPTRVQAVAEIATLAQPLSVHDEDADLDANAAAVITALNNQPHPRRLIVFDNVEHVSDLRGLVPRADAAHTLVTTTTATMTLGLPIPVHVFSPDQAVEHLAKLVGPDDPEGAALVAADLGYLPVALTQAATAMTLLGYHCSDYRKALTRQPLDVTLIREDGSPYPHHVAAAIHLAVSAVLTELSRRDPKLGAAAAEILASMAMLAESGVPREWLHLSEHHEMLRRRAVGELVTSSFLTPSENESIVTLHRLTARVIRDSSVLEPAVSPVESAITVLSRVEPLKLDGYLRQRAAASALAAQLNAVHAQPHSQPLTTEPEFLGAITHALFAANSLNDPYTALSLADSVQDCGHLVGPEHPDTLRSRNHLAGAYESAGDVARAIPLYEAVLADQQRVLGPEHPDTLRSRNNLAFAYESAGDVARAIPLYEAVLADRQRVLGPEHPDTLTSRNNLAGAYASAGDVARAIPLYEAVLADRQRVLGPDHPDTLRSRHNLAFAYASAGEVGRAIPLYEAVLADAERSLGPQHPTTQVFRANFEYAQSLQESEGSSPPNSSGEGRPRGRRGPWAKWLRPR